MLPKIASNRYEKSIVPFLKPTQIANFDLE
jgi:hypothetical protein